MIWGISIQACWHCVTKFYYQGPTQNGKTLCQSKNSSATSNGGGGGGCGGGWCGVLAVLYKKCNLMRNYDIKKKKTYAYIEVFM